MAIKDICRVSNRGVIFTFDDDITVYLIDTDQRWFLCDTHLGPQSMDSIKNYISRQSKKKEVIVFNSHSDWDHIWGNCAFEKGIIIGHETCRKRMNEIGTYDLARLPEYHCGIVQIVLPNVTFSDKLTFAEDEIEFIYAPGHTIDSTICFDKKDSVLFLGDLVEHPIPYLDFDGLETYIKTLDFIKKIPAKVKVSSHSGIIDNALIESNIAYIKNISQDKFIDPLVYHECPSVHHFNINNRLFLKYEKMIRIKLRDKFDYTQFRSNFENLQKVSYTDLQEALDFYYTKL